MKLKQHDSLQKIYKVRVTRKQRLKKCCRESKENLIRSNNLSKELGKHRDGSQEQYEIVIQHTQDTTTFQW